MQDIPIGIRFIRIVADNDLAIRATFSYRLPKPTVSQIDEIVVFDKAYSFTEIIGAEFSESEINEWVKAHDSQWDKAGFLLDKINERRGSRQ